MSDGDEASNIIEFPKKVYRTILIKSDTENQDTLPLEDILQEVKDLKPEWVGIVAVDENEEVSVFSSTDNIFEFVYYLAWAQNFLLTAGGDDSSDEDYPE